MESRKEILAEIAALNIKNASHVCKDAGMGEDDYKMEVYAEYLHCGDLQKAIKLTRDAYTVDGYLAGKSVNAGVDHTKFQKTLTGLSELSQDDFLWDTCAESLNDLYAGSDIDYFDENNKSDMKPVDYYIQKDRELTKKRILERIPNF